ncbi:mitochondrial intermediate peptidase, mitochondrial isoform X3 [Daucus carota subsp. sativus]|uniref:mitochondrial intermediate peptidase, mitochondrial isoform X3 n=1 Tax=Daucus carota subsp. sativus TaxID=79200 RepID=UPI003083AA4B
MLSKGELVDYIAGMPSSKEILQAMDEISDTVCTVLDSTTLCRQTHPDRLLIVGICSRGNKGINENERISTCELLNTNRNLYNAVAKAEQDKSLPTEEDKRAAYHLRFDFEKGGVHLCSDKLDRVNKLNGDIAQLCMEFSENIDNDPGHVDVPASVIPKHLHHLVKPIKRYKSLGSTSRHKEKEFRIVTEQNTLHSILQHVPDDKVRKIAYARGNSVPHANLAVLDKLIAARHELAQIVGYKSYAEYCMQLNLSSSPNAVFNFLLEMSEMVRPMADEEFEAIWNFKKEKFGQDCGDLEPWDETYLTGLMKSSASELDFSVVSSYFPLSQCIEGLKVLAESLFGMTFRSIPVAPGETWHPDVLKMSLYHPDEGDLGYLYLDLTSRKGKYPGCAHYTIKGGRRISESDYQLPVVALVCNFSESRNSSTVRLSHSEVETLFHEFGHALHSLLSRTDYQHFSGTRVAFDLAETPSNLFEYYAWDYRVLRTFSKHYSTGEPIPEKLVEALHRARKMFAATELQRQIFYAMVDQKFFGEELSVPKDTVAIFRDLKMQHTSWKHMEGTHWHTRFTHLLNYGAGYYTYLYAKCFAATIWQKICKDDPLSRATGSAIRMRLLQHGGAKDPADLLNDLAGDGILSKFGGDVVPDVSSLYGELGLRKR